MPASTSDQALDTLQNTINEVLVQTGKAFRHVGKDGQRDLSQGSSALRAKMPEIMDKFHSALDDLEVEVVRAQGALLRDLERLQAARMPVEQPQPVVAQSKEPMVIDLDSPEAPTPPIKPTVARSASSTPQRTAVSVAPFPDMGMPMPVTAAPDISLSTKREKATPQAAPVAPMSSSAPSVPKPSPKQTPIPPPVIPSLTPKALPVPKPQPTAPPAPEASMASLFDLPEGSESGGIPQGELNFTDMEFTLAPTGSEIQSQNPPGSTDFDLTSFEGPDVGASLMSLDGLLPAGADVSQTSHEASQQTAAAANKPEDVKAEKILPAADEDIFGLDTSSSVDNMNLGLDLPMSGTTDDPNSFDEFFFVEGDSQVGGLTDMEHGQFDETYFNLD